MIVSLHCNLKVEVDEGERTIAKGMPSMSYRGGRCTEQEQSCTSYILPPIQYPNGKRLNNFK